MNAESREPLLAVALVPGDRVGEGAHAVELREVEEVHEDGTGGRELAHDGLSHGVQPAQPSGELGRGDVGSLGSHGDAGL
jgi:hypothetical protein